eukprot:CAMPEP_0198335262 /NCGR_PEP_ID=MMETSP1450-20131203/20197_1 /TAXON_ID=753684 ORGANISM="Madagascaria erythrocladiodes, Strain CCMP3234" /NCGR_SAMPLE_ID=MMETSP1450 /ASSEMBLY_ACC=CAM_ASM_001115 /LENGTH=46 /DNA_ID= /DNA_START= /DNA_END= /DNA_ORIENTATION=
MCRIGCRTSGVKLARRDGAVVGGLPNNLRRRLVRQVERHQRPEIST